MTMFWIILSFLFAAGLVTWIITSINRRSRQWSAWDD